MTARRADGAALVEQWRNIVAGVAHTRRRLDAALEASGMSPQFFDVLYLLLRSENHALPMTLLAREISMTSGGFTKLADRMARERLIDRRSSVADRRVVNATLTPDGLAMATRSAVVYEDELRACLLAPVTAEEFAAAAAVLHTLANTPGAPAQVDTAAPSSTPFDPSQPDRRQSGRDPR